MTLTRTLLLLTLGMFLAASTARAETTLETAGVRGGLVVRIGCDDVESLAGLLASDSYLVRTSTTSST